MKKEQDYIMYEIIRNELNEVLKRHNVGLYCEGAELVKLEPDQSFEIEADSIFPNVLYFDTHTNGK